MAKVDLHLHSNYSDGSDKVLELIEKIKQAGIKIFALTDHDTIDGCKEMKQYVPKDIEFIPSIELTCKAGTIKCHILGYNCDSENTELIDLISRGKILRRHKLDTRINYLRDVWDIVLTEDELQWLYSRSSVVKTHLANILVTRGLANNNVAAMKKYLDDCKTGNSRFDGKEAINAIIASGGIPVWAHPLGGEGEIHLAENEFLPRLEVMKGFGIRGLECLYSRYSKKEIEFLVKCAKDNGLFITGGSDYHGTNKDIPLGKLNTDNIPVDSVQLTLLDCLTMRV